jgi:hypothetical protein
MAEIHLAAATRLFKQTEPDLTSYEGFVAQTKKMGELYSDLAKAAFKPFDLANVQGTKQ